LPSLAGRALDAVRVNAAANGVEFANVTAAGWAILDDADATAQRATLGLSGIICENASNLEIGRSVNGDRNCVLDFHAHGAPNSNDFSARILRNLGTNGNLDITNTGTGAIYINTGAGSLFLNGAPFSTPGSAPIYACRAWVNFNGTGTVAIRESGNVSSITDNGTGDYTVNFTTAMQDTSYGCQVSVGGVGTLAAGNALVGWAAIYAVGSVRIGLSDNNSDTNQDASNTNVAIFR